MSPDKLWWRRVPVAEKLVERTAQDLLAGRSVQIFSNMVWKEAFLEQVIAEVRDSDAGVIHNIFDGADMDPGASLIDILAEQLGFGFNFDGTLKTLTDQLQANSFCAFQMRELCPRHRSEAHQMARDLARSKARISLILEDDTQAQVKSVFQVKINPTRMDLQYYAWTLLLEEDDIPQLGYASVLCEELSGGDAERCAALCGQIHELMHDAGSVCDWLSAEDVQSAVHLAQLRGIQPIIEAQRLKFIDRLGDRIYHVLPCTDEYGGQFTRPHEVELRHLIYHRADLSLTPSELALLNQLHSARNDLSHLKILSEDVIRALAALAKE